MQSLIVICQLNGLSMNVPLGEFALISPRRGPVDDRKSRTLEISGRSSQDIVDTGFNGASPRFKLLRAHAPEMIVTASSIVE